MKNKIVKQLLGISVATMLFAQLPMFALANPYDISMGDITITATADDVHTVTYYESVGGEQQTREGDNDPVVTGSTTDYTVTINATEGDAYVTFENVNIDVSGQNNKAAVVVKGTNADNDVNIELEGDNTLKSGKNCAGLQDELIGNLIISDVDNDGSLTANGGNSGAGIGGENGKAGTGIIINGGEVTATGESGGAGIGGGLAASGTVTINGGEITATGGKLGAGIGGGAGETGTVTINGGEVIAKGIYWGAGIGGGKYGTGTVTISGGNVIAVGGEGGAGIGGGTYSQGSSLTVSGTADVRASGGLSYSSGYGAAVGDGGGYDEGTFKDPTIIEPFTGSVIYYKAGTTAMQIKDDPTAKLDPQHPYIGQLPIVSSHEQSVTTTVVIPKGINDNNNKSDTDSNNSNTNNDSETTPEYTGFTTDMLIRQINGLLKTANGGVVTIDFGRNICLTPELMKALFETGNVAKNCTFTYNGKRYNMYIPIIDTKSDKYLKAMDELKKENKGTGQAGFMRTKDIFKGLGVTAVEIK